MTGIDCARAEELLSDDCEGGLDPLFRPDLQDHLSTCPQCRPLRSAMGEVMEDLRAVPDLAPPAGLSERVAAAVARAGKEPARRGGAFRFQAAAAAVAIAGTTAVYTARGPALRQGARAMERVSNARVYLTERKDRLVEDVRILRVVVGAAFEGRFDRVNDRVEDYRRLLEKRKSAEQKKSEALPKGAAPKAAVPGANFGRTADRSIS
jgi:predicted anti-sigma-YlaC factor YlaD